MSTWFSADLHWQHTNILDYCGRPFKSIREHDDALIHNWNERVKPGDDAYIVGDVSWASAGYTVGLLKQLKGILHLIVGNHDHKLLKDQRFINCFKWVKDYHELKIGQRNYLLFHYPISSWAGMWHRNAAVISLFGHTHQKQARIDKKRAINVGVDAWNMYPVSIDQVDELARQHWDNQADEHNLESWLEEGRKYGVSKSFLLALEHKRNSWWYKLTHRR